MPSAPLGCPQWILKDLGLIRFFINNIWPSMFHEKIVNFDLKIRQFFGGAP